MKYCDITKQEWKSFPEKLNYLNSPMNINRNNKPMLWYSARTIIKKHKKYFQILMIWFLLISSAQIYGESPLAYAEVKNDPIPLTKELSFSKQVDVFFQHLAKLPEPEAKKIFNDYDPVIAKELNMENLFTTRYSALKNLLNSAVHESIDVLTLFTLPVLQQKKNKAIVLDKRILLQLNRQFNLHGLFLITAQSADDDSFIQMDFLVAGQGKFIVGYDNNKTIIHPEYFFATGRYNYNRFFLMENKTDGNSDRGLFNIKGLSNPSGSFESMQGPLNVAIKSLSFISRNGNEKKFLIKYDMFGIRKKIIPCIPIEKRYRDN